MRIAAAVLTYRAMTTGRVELLDATVASLAEADAVYVVDNGSDDGSGRYVRQRYRGFTHGLPLHTCGHGTNLQARILAGDGADICVLSDDDIAWRPGWRARLERWWSSAPDDVALTGCHLEPLFHWNKVLGRIDGPVPALVRQSTGAATWSYRAAHCEKIFPIPQQVQGYGDVPACDRLYDRGFRVCQIDLAEHVGEISTWGNRTVEMHGWDVAPALARLGGAA